MRGDLIAIVEAKSETRFYVTRCFRGIREGPLRYVSCIGVYDSKRCQYDFEMFWCELAISVLL